jgi:hypothetical protein
MDSLIFQELLISQIKLVKTVLTKLTKQLSDSIIESSYFVP